MICQNIKGANPHPQLANTPQISICKTINYGLMVTPSSSYFAASSSKSLPAVYGMSGKHAQERHSICSKIKDCYSTANQIEML